MAEELINELVEALEQADIVMETAILIGLQELQPPAYQDSWMSAHKNVRLVLSKARRSGATDKSQ